MTEKAIAMPHEVIENKIFLVRGKKVTETWRNFMEWKRETLIRPLTEISSGSLMISCFS